MSTPHHDHHERGNARLGILLFWIYFIIYAGYIVVAGFLPEIAAAQIPGGLNVATAYGFGLILLAFALAVIYLVNADKTPAPGSGGKP